MYEFMDYRAEDVMTTDVVTVTPNMPLHEVERMFSKLDFNGLPVVDEAGQMIGLVTKLDLLRAFRSSPDVVFPGYERIMQLPVRAVMTRDVQTITPMAPLTRVLDNLVSTGVKSLPVVDREELVGIVSREDVIRGLRRAFVAAPPPPPGTSVFSAIPVEEGRRSVRSNVH